MENSTKRPTGMFGFSIVWLGQIVSVLSTQMSTFALSIWVFEKTGSATSLALVQVFFITPLLLVTPLAGVMVDRHNRKLMMMMSDLAAGLATMAILALQFFGALQIWHLYVAAVFQGLGNAFQWPAYSATISTMIPKEQYGRANGMMALVQMGPGIFAPMLAGALFPIIGLSGILSIDVTTFLLAIFVLTLVHIPQPVRSIEGEQARGHILQEALFGFRYIFSRPGLLGLQLIFFFGNLSTNIAFTAITPMVLLRTDNNSVALGWVLSAGAIGGVIGAVAMSAWGGFKRRAFGVIAGWIAASFFLMLVGVGISIPIWVAAMALSALFVPLIDGSNQAIYQSKVPPDLQGRVFSARALIAWITNPVSPLIAGLLGDYVLEPAMRTSGGFSSAMGSMIVPAGPGSGMALLIIFGGLGGMLAGLTGYFVHHIRDVETVLPDHDQVSTVALT